MVFCKPNRIFQKNGKFLKKQKESPRTLGFRGFFYFGLWKNLWRMWKTFFPQADKKCHNFYFM